MSSPVFSSNKLENSISDKQKLQKTLYAYSLSVKLHYYKINQLQTGCQGTYNKPKVRAKND
ncbi:MAG: hypothetical protein C0410_13465 [Anaerolinea sp.]|nr:hypothetical protein [Anaerolinea sp.]